DEEEKKEEKYQKQEKEECEKQEESEGSEENKEKTYKSCNVIKTYREKLQNKMDLDKILEEDFEWLANESYGCAILAVDEKNIHAELKIIEIMLILALKETKTNNPNPAGSKPNRLRSIPEIEEFTLLSKRFFDFVKKIPEYEKSKKLNLLVVRLEDFIRNLESKKEKGIRIDAYIGISKKCCRKCFYAIESVREVMTGLTNLPRVSGSHYQTFEGNPPNFLGSKRNHRGSAKAGMANVILQNIRNAFWIKMSGVHASPLKTMSPDSPHFIPSSGSSTPLGVNNEPFSFDEGQAYLFDFMEKGWSDIDKTLLEPSEMLQKGWNCFDVAINVEISKHPEVRSFDRSDFIPYALNQMNSPECRSLLAPEIRHAAALAALAANFEEGSLEAQREIMDLFKLAEELPDDAATKRALEQEGNDILDKNNKKNQELVAFALPRSMWTEELRQLFTDYIEAHENMHGPWASCNDQIGRTEGSRLSIKELDEFFSHKDNRDKHKEAYSAYKEMRDEIFVPYEQAFLDYCSSEATCRTYIEQYYGQQGWFAFQNNTAERSTSMIDIVSRYIQMDILIYHQVSGELLYSTRKDDCSGFPKQLAITFNGHNHFTAGDPRIDQSMQIMENTTSLHVTDSITNSDNSEIRVLAASMSAILSSNVVYDSMALQLIVGYSSDASDMSEVGGNQNSDELAPSSH
ncbi:MAG: hypothetical protein K0R24_726, partial [Gammaproteobacteria bacterium]|nr:hypothetical protein [Gammaproteobacteria bacterium]